MRSSKKTSKTQFAILGMLSIEPMSGYQIKQTMLQSTHYFWVESDGQLYPHLSKLLEESAVTCEPEISEGGRQRKIYKISKQGKQMLRNWLLEDDNKFQIRNEFLLKLFFGANRSIEANIAQIEDMIRNANKFLTQTKSMAEHLKTTETNSPHLPFWLLTIDHGQAMQKAKLKWGEQAIKLLQQLEKNDV